MFLINSVKNIASLLKYNLPLLVQSFGPDNDYKNTITNFINGSDLSSKTNYLIFVDLSSYRTNIFTGKLNNWTLVKSYICSIGKPITPTPTGIFTITGKGYSFGQNHGYICYYYSQFKGNYLFHSILYNLNGTIRDGRLGMKISNGCIRLLKINAKWIYDNIPYGTTVYIK